jgi:hypothetical protein
MHKLRSLIRLLFRTIMWHVSIQDQERILISRDTQACGLPQPASLDAGRRFVAAGLKKQRRKPRCLQSPEPLALVPDPLPAGPSMRVHAVARTQLDAAGASTI